jgi:hypothetical protein
VSWILFAGSISRPLVIPFAHVSVDMVSRNTHGGLDTHLENKDGEYRIATGESAGGSPVVSVELLQVVTR